MKKLVLLLVALMAFSAVSVAGVVQPAFGDTCPGTKGCPKHPDPGG